MLFLSFHSVSVELFRTMDFMQMGVEAAPIWVPARTRYKGNSEVVQVALVEHTNTLHSTQPLREVPDHSRVPGGWTPYPIGQLLRNARLVQLDLKVRPKLYLIIHSPYFRSCLHLNKHFPRLLRLTLYCLKHILHYYWRYCKYLYNKVKLAGSTHKANNIPLILENSTDQEMQSSTVLVAQSPKLGKTLAIWVISG